jgi:hypothetical protein
MLNHIFPNNRDWKQYTVHCTLYEYCTGIQCTLLVNIIPKRTDGCTRVPPHAFVVYITTAGNYISLQLSSPCQANRYSTEKTSNMGGPSRTKRHLVGQSPTVPVRAAMLVQPSSLRPHCIILCRILSSICKIVMKNILFLNQRVLNTYQQKYTNMKCIQISTDKAYGIKQHKNMHIFLDMLRHSIQILC